MKVTRLLLFLVVALPHLVVAQSRPSEPRAVVLLIDKSGSMRDEMRFPIAQEAVKLVVRQMRDSDFLGVIAFDLKPVVVLWLESLGRVKGIIETRIDRLKPLGETDFLPALDEAKQQLQGTKIARKLVVLLSDGVSRGSPDQLSQFVVGLRKELGATVSTIAIGKEADTKTMKLIAQSGGGAFSLVCDPAALATVLVNQVLSETKHPSADDSADRCS